MGLECELVMCIIDYDPRYIQYQFLNYNQGQGYKLVIVFQQRGGKTLFKNRNNVPYADSDIFEWYDFNFLDNKKGTLCHVRHYAVAMNGKLHGACQYWDNSGALVQINSRDGSVLFSVLRPDLLIRSTFENAECQSCNVAFDSDNSYVAECSHAQCYQCADRVNHLCATCGARM